MFPVGPGPASPAPSAFVAENPGMVAPQVPSSIPMPPPDVAMSAAARELLGDSGKTPNTESGSASSFA